MLRTPTEVAACVVVYDERAQVCSKFILRHQHLHERIREKLVEAMDALQTAKAKSNILYVVHDVIKSVRAGFPQKDRNEKMRESHLVGSLGKVLYALVQALPEDVKHGVRVCACRSLRWL